MSPLLPRHTTDRQRIGSHAQISTLLVALAVAILPAAARAAEEVMPKHITPATLKAVRAGLDYLAKSQGPDGSWTNDEGGRSYPVAVTGLAGTALLANGNTSSRGRYSPQVQKTTEFLLGCSTSSGLLTGPGQDNGQPMHGHGFALMYLALAYGSETKPALRDKTKKTIDKAVKLTAEGQSSEGGWWYIPGGENDEGSVTVTQVQALRAAHNAGLAVPRGTISQAVQYIERAAPARGESATRCATAVRRGWPSRPRPWPRSTMPDNTMPRSPTAAWNTCGAIFKMQRPGATAATTFIASSMHRRLSTWRGTNTGMSTFPLFESS